MLSTRQRILYIVGSPHIVQSWNPWSPAHHFVTGAGATGMEMHRERYMKRYNGYFNCIHFFEMLFRILGSYWAIQVLILNTGTQVEKDNSRWYSDESSLQTTVWVTFSIPIVLLGV